MTTVEEERARQSAREAAKVANEIADSLTDDGANSWTDCSNAARLGYLAGHAASATEDRAALERANGLLRLALDALGGEGDRLEIFDRLTAYLSEEPTP
jgi:hypothetical protein